MNSVLLNYYPTATSNEKTLIDCSYLLIFSFFFFLIQIPILQVTKTQLTQRALKQHLRLLSQWMHLIWYVVWLFFCFNYFVLDWKLTLLSLYVYILLLLHLQKRKTNGLPALSIKKIVSYQTQLVAG